MSQSWRIGLVIVRGDPFWVQVQESIYQTAHQLEVELIRLDLDPPGPASDEEQLVLVDEILAQELDALVMLAMTPGLVFRILGHAIPIIYLNETTIRHPLFVSPQGLYDSGKLVGAYLAERLPDLGQVVIVGGGHLGPVEDDGGSRLAGIRDALRPLAHLKLHHIPCPWNDRQVAEEIKAGMQHIAGPVEALIGLSDLLALAALGVGQELGLVDRHTLVTGINGDPAAMSAIALGTMAATADTPAAEFGQHAVALACLAAQHMPLPTHFSFEPRLVTAENVADIALQKLIAVADLPTRLVGVNRQQEQRRLKQLELSLEINRRVGSILNPRRLSHEIADLIRTHFDYDQVQLFLWSEPDKMLVLDQAGAGSSRIRIPVAEAGVLGHALERSEPIFIPDMRHSYRFPPDPYWPTTRSRVVLPIRLGNKNLGVLDLHCERPTQHTQQELIGLQSLAEQLGIAMQNAELYSEAEQARAVAEKADQLKTRLLANVSHELRTPLNVILGYSQAALSRSETAGFDLLTVPRNDLQQIYHSGEHLIRLINDLLDLSRAEIDALELLLEPITTRSFLQAVFRSIADSVAARDDVAWFLELPEELPTIEADPGRLRQILLNLLSNADKFTQTGEIVLGAEVLPPYLHVWVRDTGSGIPAELQERIFEPFVSVSQAGQNRGGAGLGLAITRRLVGLHGGTMTLESQIDRGSTFHVYLPLVSIQRVTSAPGTPRESALLFISTRDEAPPALVAWAQHRHVGIRWLSLTDYPETLLQEVQPAALAWDLADAGQEAWTLIERFRANHEFFQAPLLLYNQERGIIPNLSLGMTNVLTKPLNQQTLLGTISALNQTDTLGPIVIIDDDPQTCEFYQTLISRAFPDYPVLTAPNGVVALSILAREKPSLVLLDLMLPEIDGFDVLAQLRLDPHTRQVPVLIISGRMLSLDDIRRLDYANVVVQSKEMLSAEETVVQLRQVLHGVDTLPQQTSRVVKRAIAFLHQHYAETLSRQQIAEAVGVSKDYLGRIFHQELGLSPWEYLNRYRITRAKALLRSTDIAIADVAIQVGFDDSSYFGRVFHRAVGCSPRAYREGPD